MSKIATYPTEPLKCWNKAKEIRQRYYERYRDIKDQGGIRWAGGAWSLGAVPAGLGRDVASLTSEPYGASIAFDKDLSLACMEATEKQGFARDLCAYMRNYWGSVILDKYAFGGGYPKPDFIWQDHICCSHAKWYQVVSDLEGGLPHYCVDVSVGPADSLNDAKIQYLVDQMQEGIAWLEMTTGRRYDDELLIDACKQEFRSTSLWAEICTLNKAVPAPLDEKSMYSLYVLGTLEKHSKEVADFYEELRDEVADRVDRGVAAVKHERCRLISDTQPPWAFLKVFRYLEDFGAISVGSLDTFALIGLWEVKPDGTWGARTTPMDAGVDISTRDAALRAYAEWNLHKPEWQHFYSPKYKSDMMIRICKEWQVDGVMLHYNRGCEGLSLGIAENRLALLDAGFPVLPFEGNMGDEREFDEARTMSRMDSFMETLELDRIVEALRREAMITAGIDMGAKTIKVVVLRDGEVLATAIKVAGLDAAETATNVMKDALASASIERSAVQRVVATGAGRDEAPDKDATLTEVGCATRGAIRLYPEARTVVDVGAEEGRAIRNDERGKVVDFAVNEKCAAGAGAFTEAMARALEVSVDKLGPLSLKSTKAIPMNAQCAVFAESEVVSMIHNNVEKPDMARAVHDAMASRIISMVRKVGYNPPVVLLGGLAKNTGFVDSLKRGLEIDRLHIPDEPEFTSALGAALAAAEQA